MGAKKKQFKVKVISSEKPTYWYSDSIGDIFNVEIYDRTDYVVLPMGLLGNRLIKKSDCEKI